MHTSSSNSSLSNEFAPNKSSLFNNSSSSNTDKSQNFNKSKAVLENLFGGQTSAQSSVNVSPTSYQEPPTQYNYQQNVQSPQQDTTTNAVTKPNYHKPNLAPKPPGQNNGTSVTRHQSMRTPKYGKTFQIA